MCAAAARGRRNRGGGEMPVWMDEKTVYSPNPRRGGKRNQRHQHRSPGPSNSSTRSSPLYASPRPLYYQSGVGPPSSSRNPVARQSGSGGHIPGGRGNYSRRRGEPNSPTVMVPATSLPTPLSDVDVFRHFSPSVNRRQSNPNGVYADEPYVVPKQISSQARSPPPASAEPTSFECTKTYEVWADPESGVGSALPEGVSRWWEENSGELAELSWSEESIRTLSSHSANTTLQEITEDDDEDGDVDDVGASGDGDDTRSIFQCMDAEHFLHIDRELAAYCSLSPNLYRNNNELHSSESDSQDSVALSPLSAEQIARAQLRWITCRCDESKRT